MLLMERTEGGASDTYWYHYDGLGSVVALTDETGADVCQWKYDEYGNLLQDCPALNHYTYTGQEYDAETGLLHFFARYYDANVGVWVTLDVNRGAPEEPKSLHRIGYAYQNPIILVDIDGFAVTIYLCSDTSPMVEGEEGFGTGHTWGIIEGCDQSENEDLYLCRLARRKTTKWWERVFQNKKAEGKVSVGINPPVGHVVWNKDKKNLQKTDVYISATLDDTQQKNVAKYIETTSGKNWSYGPKDSNLSLRNIAPVTGVFGWLVPKQKELAATSLFCPWCLGRRNASGVCTDWAIEFWKAGGQQDFSDGSSIPDEILRGYDPNNSKHTAMYPISNIKLLEGEMTTRDWGMQQGISTGSEIGKTVGNKVGKLLGGETGETVGGAVGSAVGGMIGEWVGEKIFGLFSH
jgi:RHS repeat-associated protein